LAIPLPNIAKPAAIIIQIIAAHNSGIIMNLPGCFVTVLRIAVSGFDIIAVSAALSKNPIAERYRNREKNVGHFF